MFMLRNATKYLFGNARSQETIVEIPQGQLYLVRPLSPKGYSELIYPDANCSIRRTGQQYQYQLVVQRVFEEGAQELEAEEDADLEDEGLGSDKDEKTFLLDEELRFRTDKREGGEIVFAWNDLSGDEGDLFEFVCDSKTQATVVAAFEAVAAQCQYERKFRRPHEDATERDLEQFVFAEQAIPDTGSRASISEVSRDMTPQVKREATPSKSATAAANSSADVMGTLQTIGLLYPSKLKHPEGQEVLASEECELHVFEHESGNFVEQDHTVTATVYEVGNWTYWLQITGKKRDWLSLAVTPELNPVFNFEYRSFIFNHYPDERNAFSWLLRFKSEETEEHFQEGLMRALWEHLNETKWLKAKNTEREYALEAFQDLTMEDAPPEEEEEEDEEAEESDDEAPRSEHYDTDEEEDDRITGPGKSKDVNSQLAVGFKNDRSYVVRGNQIGVFKQGERGQHLDFQTNINKVATPKGRHFSPKKVMLHAEDRDMILQDPGSENSLYRMDLEYGKVVDEYRVHEDIPVLTFAPEQKYAQTTGQQSFLGLSHNALYRIDPRLSGDKLVDSTLKQYASKNGFSAAATTANGYIAVASSKGDIRMFDRLGIQAKTNIPALGDPILGLDASGDGRWLLATTRTYLLLIDCLQKEGKNAGKLGFEKSFAADAKPRPRRLALAPAHVAQLTAETKKGIHFTPARFNTGEGTNETSIVTATGPFVVAWSMKKVLTGQKDPYSIKRYAEEVKADEFQYRSDRNLVVALENQVGLEKKSALQRPTRESFMGRNNASSGRYSGGGRLSTPARRIKGGGVVDSPF
ncbi:MAG: hypothetical protein Q9159_003088 [Coniocarpon cinnabarinum]